MLPNNVFIFQPASVSGSTYTIDLFFQDVAQAVFLRLGDVIEDTVNNQYEVIAPTTIPNADGNTVTVNAITNNVLPVEDSGFDSSAFTPGQVDLKPQVRTSGSLSAPSLFSGPDYEYNAIVGWNDPAEADKAAVGDRIVDFAGKEFSISFLDTNRFADPIRVVEVEKVGVFPTVGDATLYRPTSRFGFFQGTPLSAQATATIQARDAQLVDQVLLLNGDWREIFHTITAGEATAKSFTFSPTPQDPLEVAVEVQNGVSGLTSGTDYVITGNVFSWSGLELDGLLSAGDVIKLQYFA